MFFTTVQCITASSSAESLCGIVLTVVRKGRLYQQKRWLFCPPALTLSPSHLGDPSITLADLVDAPKLYELWDEIVPYLDRQLLIFHKLPENIRALSKALSYYHLNEPRFTFGSTMMLAKRLYPNLTNCKLSTLCQHLMLTKRDQDTFSYTTQMAELMMAMGKQFHVSDEEALFAKAGICLGSYQADGICYPDFLSPYEPPVQSISSDAYDLLELDSLRNEVICLTGPLESMTRSMAVKELTRLGAHYQSQVTTQTTLVVTNLYDPQTATYKRVTSKLQKALLLKGQGQKLTIIDESLFLKRLKHSK